MDVLDILNDICLKNPRSNAMKFYIYHEFLTDPQWHNRREESPISAKIPAIKIMRNKLKKLYPSSISDEMWVSDPIWGLKRCRENVEYLFGYHMEHWNPYEI